MTIRFWICLGVLTVGVTPVLSAATQESADSPKEETTELGKHMDQMNRAFRKLRRQAGDQAMNASSLELVATMQSAAKDAAVLTPAMAEDVPAADRAKFMDGYHKEIQKLSSILDKLEIAFKAGENDTAKDLISELLDTKKEGHHDYKKPDSE